MSVARNLGPRVGPYQLILRSEPRWWADAGHFRRLEYKGHALIMNSEDEAALQRYSGGPESQVLRDFEAFHNNALGIETWTTPRE